MEVFVESGDSLGRELASEPIGFLDQTHAASAPCRSQRRRYTTRPSADNEYVARHVDGMAIFGDGNQG
jgi:hypothetical protein